MKKGGNRGAAFHPKSTIVQIDAEIDVSCVLHDKFFGTKFHLFFIKPCNPPPSRKNLAQIIHRYAIVLCSKRICHRLMDTSK